MISSVRLDGTTACIAIRGCDHEVFRADVREVLIPSLRPVDIVVMDKLGAHKSWQAIGLIEQVGDEVRFPSAYSRDLNPIEMMWSKVKSLLRKAQPRTRPDLLAATSSALASVNPQDASGWFTHCGNRFV
jgi:transposase